MILLDRKQTHKYTNFPWQEKLVAPLIATPDEDTQFRRLSDKRKEGNQKKATGYKVVHLIQIGRSPSTNYEYVRSEFKTG